MLQQKHQDPDLYFLKDKLALLERAISNFMLDCSY